MSARVYLITEGVHDVAFLFRILQKAFAFTKVDEASALDEAWRHILPTWPYQGKLRGSVPAPTFCKNDAVSVAIVNAEGIDKIEPRLRAHHVKLTDQGIGLDAVGVVLDADFKKAKQKTPAARFAEMADILAALDFPRPTSAEVVSGTPRTGIYILPGGGELGTLEDVLLECAAITYPTLGCRAVQFIDRLDRTAPEFTKRDLDEISALSGRHKAVLGAMTAVLKPGKATQASIEDHRWIEPSTLALPRVAAIVEFLRQLIGDRSNGR